MPRARSDKIWTHRIEMGKWERDSLGPIIQMSTLAASAGVVAVGGAAALAAYGLFWFFDATAGIRNDIKTNLGGAVDEVQDIYSDPLQYVVPVVGPIKLMRRVLGI